MGFQTPIYKLSWLLEQIEDGKLQLPDFQRRYRWDDERVRSLLVTISLGYPLGVVMTLQTEGQHVRFQPTPVEGTPDSAAAADPSLLLLDGQQRLTSFYQALTGDGVVHTKDGDERRYYLDIAKALDDPSARDDAIISVPKDGVIRSNFGRDVDLDLSTPELEREHGHFPVRLIYNQTDLLPWIFAFEDKVAVQRFHAEILQPLIDYRIPAIELEKDTTKGAVATVFEKVNTGGMSLTVFELLTAKFAGDADYHRTRGKDFRLKQDWEETEKVIAKQPALTKFSNTDFLQAVTLLATRNKPLRTTSRQDHILALELDEYLQWAPKVRMALEWVGHFLDQEKIHTAKDVPYPAQLVPLVVIRALLGDVVGTHGPRRLLAQWFWCGVLGEIYSGSTETRAARDVDEVPDWLTDEVAAAPVPATVANATFTESRLLRLRTKNSAAYKGVYALIMQNECSDWREQQPFDTARYADLSVDIHHIFPQAWCRNHKIEPERYDSVVNKTPLAKLTNQIIGSAAPSKYMDKLAKSAKITNAALDAIVAQHHIDAKLLRADNFDAFFVARRQALVGLIEAAMGKAVQRDVDDDPSPMRIGLKQALRRTGLS